MQLLEKPAVAPLLGARQGALYVLEGELQIVARSETPHVQIRRGAEHLRIIGIERQGAGVRRAGLLDVAQLGERGGAAGVRRDAGTVGAGGFERALQRIVLASAAATA